MRIVDLSRDLYHRTPNYPGQPPIIHGVWKRHEESFIESGRVHGNSVMYFSMPDHGGTHIDAPRHFGPNATPINEGPLESCIVNGVSASTCATWAPGATITPGELEAAVAKAGVGMPAEGTVLLCTGHHARTYPTAAYASDNPRGERGGHRMARPAGHRPPRHQLHAARVRKARSTRSCTRRAWSSTSPTSRACAIWKRCIGQGEFRFIGLPLKWRGGTGSPIRAVAVFDL